MGRRPAKALHLALALLGAVLYFVFVIPRWWVLLGYFPNTLATVGQIAAGLAIGLAAVPVVLFLQQSLNPDHRTPEIALRLRAWSGVLHVAAGVLIVLTAIAEIWLHASPWLFAVYGAAGAAAILGVLAFSLSFIAEKPAHEPNPAKPAKEKKPRGKRKRAETEVPDADIAVETAEDESTVDETVAGSAPTDVEQPTDDTPAATGGLRNKRPTGKSRNRLRP